MTDRPAHERLREFVQGLRSPLAIQSAPTRMLADTWADTLDALADEVEEEAVLTKRIHDNFLTACGQIEKLQARVAELEGAVQAAADHINAVDDASVSVPDLNKTRAAARKAVRAAQVWSPSDDDFILCERCLDPTTDEAEGGAGEGES